MINNSNPSLSELFPLPEGIKINKYRLGTKSMSPLVPARRGLDADSKALTEFKICWEDAGLGLAVVVREQADGRLLADVNSGDVNHLDKAAVSVALVGGVTDRMIRKTIPLKVPEPNGCSGSADFGPLTNAVNELGPQLGIIVMLLL